MTTKIEQRNIINHNDNFKSSWLRIGDWEFIDECAYHIPLANLLIEKHCNSWWKNHPETWEYQRAQQGLCAQLHIPRSSREWKLRILSRDLECSPLELMNDPSPELMNINS